MTQTPDLNSRIVELESSLSYMQHDLQQISQVVLDQQKQIEGLQKQIDRWNEMITPEQQDLPDPLQEKPPHY
jgi:SlyX protein